MKNIKAPTPKTTRIFAAAFIACLAFPALGQEAGKGKKDKQASEAAAAHPAKTLIAKGHEDWKYFEGGKSPGAQWTAIDFDDSAWKKGAAPLGYGEKDIKTKIGFGGNPESKHRSAFFRTSFSVKDPKTAGKFAGGIRCDDGAVVHLNGKEVFRRNVFKIKGLALPAEKQTASAAIGPDGPVETNLWFFEIKAEDVKPGKNVIAVSVHQSSGQSSDLVLDLKLVAMDQKSFDALKAKVTEIEKNDPLKKKRDEDPFK